MGVGRAEAHVDVVSTIRSGGSRSKLCGLSEGQPVLAHLLQRLGVVYLMLGDDGDAWCL